MNLRVCRTLTACLAIALGLVASSSTEAADPASLRFVISIRHPGVDWVTTEQLALWLEGSEGTKPLLLDTRTPEELAISRIAGAERVDPDAKTPAPEGVAPDRLIVVYCAVGYRSAAIARRLEKQGFERVYNLQGGIFEWANEGRPIVDGQGEPARFVHPFAKKWHRYLDASLRSYDGAAPTD